MSRTAPWLVVCACLLASGPTLHAEDNLLGMLKRQAREFDWKNLSQARTSAAEAGLRARELQEDGHWQDIDYTDQTRDSWKTEAHLSRVVAIATDYEKGKIEGRPDLTLRDAALAATHYWVGHDYRNPNWWQNEIAVPRDMTTVLLMMGDEMSGEDRAAALKIAQRARISMTGQNLVWKAGIVFRRALVEGNLKLARQGRDAILDELKVTGSEGLQADDSFQQHGAQQQMGNYGLAFASDMVAWSSIWRGTALATPEDKLVLLRDYLLKGESMVVSNQAMDVSACGRQLYGGVAQTKGRVILALLAEMRDIDPAHAREYETAAAEGSQTAGCGSGVASNKDFFRSDYMAHRRPAFFASVKLCSDRVIGEEMVNAENVSGRYLADGATFIYQTSREYSDIFPVWDWRRIPGVTCVTTGTTLAPEGKMVTQLAGGVSDGHYGAVGLDYHRDRVSARKAWFFLDEGVECLGAGISGTSGMVRTSIDQRLAEGVTVTSQGSLGSSVSLCKQVTWVLNGNEGYLFPQPRDVWAGTQTQKGTWKNVYGSGPASEIAKNVFSIWIEHLVAGDSYAYTIVPAATRERLQSYVAKPPVLILSNTPGVQAVRDEAAQVTEILFYGAGELNSGVLSITAEGPCAVIIRGDQVYVADPTQKQSQIALTINGENFLVKLPQGEFAGSTVKAKPG